MLARRFTPPWRSLARPVDRQLYLSRAQSSQATSASRIDRITSRLPRRLQRYTAGLRNAPVSHVVSFLILHEMTAILPIFALFGLFHHTNYVPVAWMADYFGTYVQGGVARFERYFSRKGWFGFGQEGDNLNSPISEIEKSGSKDKTDQAMEGFQRGEQKYRILMEVALAYALTKAALPVRIIASVWATPWFAGFLVRARSAISRRS